MPQQLVDQAFAAWREAHEALVAAEKKAGDAWSAYAMKSGQMPVELQGEVEAKRRESDRLLAQAMEVLKTLSAPR